MKTLVLTLGLLLASTAAVAEREGGKHGGDRAEHRARVQQELGLTEEQMEQMREIREQGGSREEIRAVLTPEQQTRAAELRKKKQAGRIGRMQQHLGLSDEQVAQMEEIQAQGGSREEMHAVLTEEQRSKLDAVRRSHKGKSAPPE